MKYFLTIWSIFLLSSCSDKDETTLIQKLNKISVFDVGNEGNSTDIRVRFSLIQLSEIEEMRIIVIPANIAEEFSKRDAFILPEDSYKSLPFGSDNYSERLSIQLDVNGNTIIESKEYVIKILMLGDRFNQLSIINSNVFTLNQVGIYNGVYFGNNNTGTWDLYLQITDNTGHIVIFENTAFGNQLKVSPAEFLIQNDSVEMLVHDESYGK